MLCLLQDGSRGHTLHQCQTWQWEPPARQLWPCKQKLRVWAKTSPSFPIVRSTVPATPGAPPEVFVEARMELWAAIRGLFYIRIESTGKTILTDLVVGNSAICRLFVQMSVYPTTLALWSKHVRHSNSKCWMQIFFFKLPANILSQEPYIIVFTIFNILNIYQTSYIYLFFTSHSGHCL